MRMFLAAVLLTLAAGGAAVGQTPALPSTDPAAVDPFAWLEDIHGARALDWVKTENARRPAGKRSAL